MYMSIEQICKYIVDNENHIVHCCRGSHNTDIPNCKEVTNTITNV